MSPIIYHFALKADSRYGIFAPILTNNFSASLNSNFMLSTSTNRQWHQKPWIQAASGGLARTSREKTTCKGLKFPPFCTLQIPTHQVWWHVKWQRIVYFHSWKMILCTAAAAAAATSHSVEHSVLPQGLQSSIIAYYMQSICRSCASFEMLATYVANITKAEWHFIFKTLLNCPSTVRLIFFHFVHYYLPIVFKKFKVAYSSLVLVWMCIVLHYLGRYCNCNYYL